MLQQQSPFHPPRSFLNFSLATRFRLEYRFVPLTGQPVSGSNPGIQLESSSPFLNLLHHRNLPSRTPPILRSKFPTLSGEAAFSTATCPLVLHSRARVFSSSPFPRGKSLTVLSSQPGVGSTSQPPGCLSPERLRRGGLSRVFRIRMSTTHHNGAARKRGPSATRSQARSISFTPQTCCRTMRQTSTTR